MQIDFNQPLFEKLMEECRKSGTTPHRLIKELLIHHLNKKESVSDRNSTKILNSKQR